MIALILTTHMKPREFMMRFKRCTAEIGAFWAVVNAEVTIERKETYPFLRIDGKGVPCDQMDLYRACVLDMEAGCEMPGSAMTMKEAIDAGIELGVNMVPDWWNDPVLRAIRAERYKQRSI